MQEQLMPKYIIIHDKKLNKMFSIFSKNMVDMKTVQYHLNQRSKIDLNDTERYSTFGCDSITAFPYYQHGKEKVITWVDKEEE